MSKHIKKRGGGEAEHQQPPAQEEQEAAQKYQPSADVNLSEESDEEEVNSRLGPRLVRGHTLQNKIGMLTPEDVRKNPTLFAKMVRDVLASASDDPRIN